MNLTDLSAEEREFLRGVQAVRRMGRSHYLAFIAVTICIVGETQPMSSFIAEFDGESKGTLKRAIKIIRSLQQEYPYPDTSEEAVNFIRSRYKEAMSNG